MTRLGVALRARHKQEEPAEQRGRLGQEPSEGRHERRLGAGHAQAAQQHHGYLDPGRIPVDNGLVERLFRRVATVRKNALFVGSHDGGRRAAVLFRILLTSELIGLNPEAFLAGVLPPLARGIRLAEDLPALMPAAHPDAAVPDAAVPALNVQRVSRFND